MKSTDTSEIRALKAVILSLMVAVAVLGTIAVVLGSHELISAVDQANEITH